MWQKINRNINRKFAIGFIMAVTIFFVGFLTSQFISISFPAFPGFPRFSINVPSFPPISTLPSIPKIVDVKKFTSEEEFKSYLKDSELSGLGMLGGARAKAAGVPEQGFEALPMPWQATDGIGGGGGEEPERVSETNVQVAGIDESDIVKTDGKEIYFSSLGYYIGMNIGLRLPGGDYLPPETGKTKVIKAFPPADLAIDKEIDKTGDLLLKNNILMIFSGEKIYGYNVSNPKNPEKNGQLS
jgi:inhibitor of cysteine peptidase